jgi:hypothetical protein
VRFLLRLTILFVVGIVGLSVLGHLAYSSSSPCVSGVASASGAGVTATGQAALASAQNHSVQSEVVRGVRDSAKVVADTYRFISDLAHHQPAAGPAGGAISSAVGASTSGVEVVKSVVARPGVRKAGSTVLGDAASCLSGTTTPLK